MPETRIGISGWRYEPWRGVFYPKGLAQKRELEFASRQFNSIEINGTFYSLQRPGSFREWYGAVPEGFVFAIKCPQYITHRKRLRNFAEPLANFYASGVLELKEKMGPFLWQFPPNFKFDEGLFEAFFAKLPRTGAEAVKVARGHGPQVKGRAFVPRDARGLPARLRHCIEFRHESFLVPAFVRLLRRMKVGLVIADTAGIHPYAEDVTADFVYVRLHGAEEIYASGYTEAALEEWARKLRAWRAGGEPEGARKILDVAAAKRKGRDVYVYFDNDIKVKAPFDAKRLARMMP
ncbi:MAG TPA: DUF72 domain-containing protein [Phycisphaerae bacterium]|nr:DUF72 domain-containing protein [Phycisphaerae bacterium]